MRTADTHTRARSAEQRKVYSEEIHNAPFHIRNVKAQTHACCHHGTIWDKDNKKAHATLYLCIDSFIRTAVIAKGFWEQLRSWHEKVTVTSRVTVLNKLCSVNLLQGGDME